MKNGTLHAHKIDFNVNKCASYKNDKANKNQIRPRYSVVTSRKHCDIGRFIGDRERREAKKICQFFTEREYSGYNVLDSILYTE